METRNLAATMVEGLGASDQDTLDDLFEALHRHFVSYWPDPRARAIAEHSKRYPAVLDRAIAGFDSGDDKVCRASCQVLFEVGARRRSWS